MSSIGTVIRMPSPPPRARGWRCCSTSCRSWPGSATRSTAGSWRSSPRSTATSCGVPPGAGRSRRWWPGRLGTSPANAQTITAIANRLGEFPRCAAGLAGGPAVAGSGRGDRRAGRPRVPMSTTRSWPQRHGQPAAHRGQAGTATPTPNPRPEPQRVDHQDHRRASPPTGGSGCPKLEAAKFDAALQSHRDALIADWKRDHDDDDRVSEHGRRSRPPCDAFMSLVEAGWDTEAARRPHGQHTTVVMHRRRRKTASPRCIWARC